MAGYVTHSSSLTARVENDGHLDRALQAARGMRGAP